MSAFTKIRGLCTLYWPSTPELDAVQPTEKASAPQPYSSASSTGATAAKESRRLSSPSSSSSSSSSSSYRFVVGWNPRGFVLCVASVVVAAHVDDVEARLEETKAAVRRSGTPLPSGLRVLGIFRGEQQHPTPTPPVTGSSTGTSATASAVDAGTEEKKRQAEAHEERVRDNGARRMRQRADIWIELVDGPRVAELYCCGLKFVPELHVIRHSPEAVFRTTPEFMTVLSRMDVSGVRGIMRGTSVVKLVISATSALEGSVLRPHVLALLGKDSSPFNCGGLGGGGGGDARNDSIVRGVEAESDIGDASMTSNLTPIKSRRDAGQLRRSNNASAETIDQDSFDSFTQSPAKDYGFGFDHGESENEELLKEDDSDGDASANVDGGEGVDGTQGNRIRTASLTSRASGSSDNTSTGREAATDMRRQPVQYQIKQQQQQQPQQVCVPDGRRKIDPSVPPRLNFDTRLSTTELQKTLDCVNCGRHIRAELREAAVSSRSSTTSQHNVASSARYRTAAVLTASLLLALTRLVEVALAVLGPFLVYSYTLRLADFRLRQLCNFLILCSRSSATSNSDASSKDPLCTSKNNDSSGSSSFGGSCGLHPIVPHRWDGCTSAQRWYCRLCFLFNIAADIALGCFLALVLRELRGPFLACVRGMGWFGLYELHIGYLEWFLGWPGGFKMNDDLNRLLHGYATTLLMWWKGLVWMNPDWDWLGRAMTVVELASVLGLSFMLSVIADCCNVATLHLRNIFHSLALLYRAFVSLLSCLSLEFRGKKWNPLRRRVDMTEFSVEQVLIATLVATAAAFLFPTVGLYYLYFALVRTSVWLVQELLTALAFVSASLPAFEVLQWLLFPRKLGGSVAFEPIRVPPPSPSHSSRGGKGWDSPWATPAASPTQPGGPPFPTSSLTSPRQQQQQQQQLLASECEVQQFQLTVAPVPLSQAIADFRVLAWVAFGAFAPSRVLGFIVHAQHKPAVHPDRTLYPHLVANPRAPPLTLKVKT